MGNKIDIPEIGPSIKMPIIHAKGVISNQRGIINGVETTGTVVLEFLFIIVI